MNWKDFYFSPHGRVTRSEWWMRMTLPIMGLMIPALIWDGLQGWTPKESPLGIAAMGVSWLTLYPQIIVSVKRLHDHDKSGWWFLIYWVPMVGWLWALIECGCLRGTVGDNRYGPDALPAPYYTPDPTSPASRFLDGSAR